MQNAYFWRCETPARAVVNAAKAVGAVKRLLAPQSRWRCETPARATL